MSSVHCAGRVHAGISVLFLFLGCGCGTAVRAQDFPGLPPLTPADMKATGMGGPALILYRAVDTDNTTSTETYSYRIKILNEEGRRHGDVEILYVEKFSQVEDIAARTIAPDGTVTPFHDQVIDQDIVKAKRFRSRAKVFSIPNVQVGSIIEYTYRLRYKYKIPEQFQHPERFVFENPTTFPAAKWDIQTDLFVKHERFTFTPVNRMNVREFEMNVPKKAVRASFGAGGLQFEMENIPAYEEEEYAPPEDTTKSWMALYYAQDYYGGDGYWLGIAKYWSKEYDKYIGKSKMVEREAARLVSPGDTAGEKLRKIYNRVQQIRSLDYEEEKLAKERKQEHLKENKNIEDVLVHGYGEGHDVDLLMIGLARAAGFQAFPVKLVSRQTSVFLKDYPNYNQLDALIVEVILPDKLVFFDPESKFCPYGLLPWTETETGGVVIATDAARVSNTPDTRSQDAVTKTTGELKLSADGTLQGKLTIVYSGQEALEKRQSAVHQDETSRRTELEESLKGALFQGADVKLTRSAGWEKSEEPLSVEFEVNIPNYATTVGHGMLIPLSVLHAAQKNPFPSARRTHPIYFEYPFESYEDFRIELPNGVQVEALPNDIAVDKKAMIYSISAKNEHGVLTISRTRKTLSTTFPLESFGAIRAFFVSLISGDSQQAVLKVSTAAN
jgi:hypothetical protein